MKRSSFLPTTRGAAWALIAAALAFGSACAPSNDVQGGAPILTELTLIAPGPTAAITITEKTADCPTTAATGVACDPSMDTQCRLQPNWCSCVADAMDMTMGKWDCSPFTVLAVVAVFDRLLDTAPFDAVYPAEAKDVVTATSTPMETFGVTTDYASNGTPMGLNPLLGFFYAANFRGHGPSLYSLGDPEFPSGAIVSVALQGSLVTAKDKTPFKGKGLLQSGTVDFTMPAFHANVVPADAMNPAKVSFTNLVPADVTRHITVLAGTTDVTAVSDLKVSDDSLTVTVSPMMADSWPVPATITINVDATTKDKLGKTIDAAATGSFMTM
jgi:hypothetical protein